MYYLCPNLLSIAIIKTMTKAARGEKDFFGLHFITEWSQGRNLNSFRTWRQELKQGLWRHSANWLVQFAFLYKLGSPAQVWYCPQGPPLSNIVQDNTPIDLPQTGQSGEGYFLNWNPLFPDELTLSQVDQKNPNQTNYVYYNNYIIYKLYILCYIFILDRIMKIELSTCFYLCVNYLHIIYNIYAIFPHK